MISSFQRRLDKAGQGAARLPERRYAEDENRQRAEQQIAELMEEFNLSRDEALTLAKEHAPLIASWCEVKG